MFGIVMAIMSLGHATIDGIKKVREDSFAIKRAQERKANGTDYTNTYFDWQGTRKDLDTHQYRRVDFEAVEHYGKDQCIYDINGNVVRNLSNERREKKYNDAQNISLATGRTVVLYRDGNGVYNGKTHREFGGDGYCEGPQFKDLKTGEMYVARWFIVKGKDKTDTDAINYYMTLDGLLVREADSTIKKRKQNEVKVSKETSLDFMKQFNEQQKQNGWYNTKDKMFFKDAFGNKTSRNFAATDKYYCNNVAIRTDV